MVYCVRLDMSSMACRNRFCPEKANMTLPAADACSGSGSPTFRKGVPTLVPEMRSSSRTLECSSTKRLTTLWVTNSTSCICGAAISAMFCRIGANSPSFQSRWPMTYSLCIRSRAPHSTSSATRRWAVETGRSARRAISLSDKRGRSGLNVANKAKDRAVTVSDLVAVFRDSSRGCRGRGFAMAPSFGSSTYCTALSSGFPLGGQISTPGEFSRHTQGRKRKRSTHLTHPSDHHISSMPPRPTRAWVTVVTVGVVAAAHIWKLPVALPLLETELGISLVTAGMLVGIIQLASMVGGLLVAWGGEIAGLRRLIMIGLLLL